MTLYREASEYLTEWSGRADRKPLILRGARQVGKTHLVREWARTLGFEVTEINLDLEKQLHSLFALEPKQIIRELAALKGDSILQKNSLLFIDEIQTCTEAIASLRYFKELIPELPVIAAGSLLDFALRDMPQPLPVGRVEFLYLYPLSFYEFLYASEGRELAQYLRAIRLGNEVSEAVNLRLTQSLRNYFFVGGMPEVVGEYIASSSMAAAQRIQSSIIQTFEADFTKYGNKQQQELIPLVFRRLVGELGKKIKYSRISQDYRSHQIQRVIELLELAGIAHRICHSSANRIPLGGEVDDSRYKLLLLDIGLVHHMAGLRLHEFKLEIGANLITALEGAMAEQYVGQELIANHAFYERKRLYYWHREAKNSNAEVDFVESFGEDIIPCEVKAGKGSTLKSLLSFLSEKRGDLGIRLAMQGLNREMVQLPAGSNITLVTLPLYCAGNVAGRNAMGVFDSGNSSRAAT